MNVDRRHTHTHSEREWVRCNNIQFERFTHTVWIYITAYSISLCHPKNKINFSLAFALVRLCGHSRPLSCMHLIDTTVIPNTLQYKLARLLQIKRIHTHSMFGHNHFYQCLFIHLCVCGCVKEKRNKLFMHQTASSSSSIIATAKNPNWKPKIRQW